MLGTPLPDLMRRRRGVTALVRGRPPRQLATSADGALTLDLEPVDFGSEPLKSLLGSRHWMASNVPGTEAARLLRGGHAQAAFHQTSDLVLGAEDADAADDADGWRVI